MATRQRVPHQLIIHLDHDPSGTVEIKWSYPFIRLPIREQTIRLSRDTISPELSRSIEKMRNFMIAKAPPVERLRVPHGHIEPDRRFDILTIAIQDERRDLPVVRLYYTEIIAGGASIEKEVRIDGRGAASPAELEVWESIHKAVCGIAWKDYQTRFRPAPR